LNTQEHNCTAAVRAYAQLADEMLALAAEENRVLVSNDEYRSTEFHARRKALLSRLVVTLNLLRAGRLAASNNGQREQFKDVKLLIGNMEDVLARILVLEHENQQALINRGLFPIRHFADRCHQPHYVADVYHRQAGIHHGHR
jgi:hypothetical protein